MKVVAIGLMLACGRVMAQTQPSSVSIPMINGNLTCGQWVFDHTAPNRDQVIAALQNGYMLGFTDAQMEMSSGQHMAPGSIWLLPDEHHQFLPTASE